MNNLCTVIENYIGMTYYVQTIASMIIGLGILISTGYIIYVTSQKKKQNKYLRTLKDPDTKVPLPLMEKQIINHDTRKYRFKLPTENHVLGNYYMFF